MDLLRRDSLAAPGALAILAVGPLANPALLARLTPEAARQAGRVVVMGGAALCAGNATPAANVLGDPEAAGIVPGFDRPVTMIDLDVTQRTILGPDHLEAIGHRHDLLARAGPLYPLHAAGTIRAF